MKRRGTGGQVEDTFFDTSVLIAGTIDFGHSSQHALLLMDAVADGRIECPLTAWHCCLEFYSVTTRLPEEYRLEPEIALRFLREEILPRFSVHDLPAESREDFLVSTAGEGIGTLALRRTKLNSGLRFVLHGNHRLAFGGPPDWEALYSVAQSQSGYFTTEQALPQGVRRVTVGK